MDEILYTFARRRVVIGRELGRELLAAQELGHLLQEMLPEVDCIDTLFHSKGDLLALRIGRVL
jgi:hypothetical protein